MTVQEIAITAEAATPPLVTVEQAATKKLGVLGWLAMIWLGGLAILAVLVPYIGAFDNHPKYTSLIQLGPFQQGSHILGVDDIGHDQLSQLLWGARSSLLLGVGSIVLAMLVGGFLGLLAGYFRGLWDTIITGVFNVLLAVPQLVLALAIVTAFANDQYFDAAGNVHTVSPQRRLLVLIITLGVVATPVLGRITRANALTWSQREFVVAARAQGAKSLSVMMREVLPNVLPAMFSIALLGVGVVIVAEGGLAILGIGVHDPNVSWGILVANSRTHLQDLPYLLFEPILFIFLTVLSLNYLGDVVRARFDVRESIL